MDDHDPIGGGDGEALYEEPTGFLYYDVSASGMIRDILEDIRSGIDSGTWDEDLNELFDQVEKGINWVGDIYQEKQAVNYDQWVDDISNIQTFINSLQDSEEPMQSPDYEKLLEATENLILTYDIVAIVTGKQIGRAHV